MVGIHYPHFAEEETEVQSARVQDPTVDLWGSKIQVCLGKGHVPDERLSPTPPPPVRRQDFLPFNRLHGPARQSARALPLFLPMKRG